MSGSNGQESIIQSVADELRSVADDLEADDLELRGPVRYTRTMGRGRELPAEVEITYWVPGEGERTVEVWI